jgi:hypothetical protein
VGGGQGKYVFEGGEGGSGGCGLGVEGLEDVV